MNLETFLQKTDVKFEYENEGKVYKIKHWTLYVPNNNVFDVELTNYNVVIAKLKKDSNFQSLYNHMMKEDSKEEKVVKKILYNYGAKGNLEYRLDGSKDFNLFCKELKECYNYFFEELPEVDLKIVWEKLKDELE